MTTSTAADQAAPAERPTPAAAAAPGPGRAQPRPARALLHRPRRARPGDRADLRPVLAAGLPRVRSGPSRAPGCPPRSPTGRCSWSGWRTAGWPATSTSAGTAGARLVTAPEPEGKAIRCPYHGWTYKLDGRLVGAPEAAGSPAWTSPTLGLHPVRVESFLGFVFANLDPDATPLAEQLPGLAEKIGRYCTDLAPITRDRIHDTEHAETQPANWKVVFDNYLEGYHVPVAHPGLMRLLDYQRYGVELHENYALFASPLRETPVGQPAGAALPAAGAAPMSGLRRRTSGSGGTWPSTRTR